ncbi:MAG: hypothetical protein HQK77_04835 [Desulfobacterales bacterium]|nr:hypothetical protein [Desulfobacterales bacterium]
MSEEKKSILKEGIIKTLFSMVIGQNTLSDDKLEAIRELIVELIEKLNKSKDELVTMFGREIGVAMAAVIKEPLSLFADNKKIQITIEVISKDDNVQKNEENKAGEGINKEETPKPVLQEPVEKIVKEIDIPIKPSKTKPSKKK